VPDRQSPFRAAGAALRAVWATRVGKVSAALLLFGIWQHWALFIPLAFYGIKLLRAGMRRLLYSVRAKLVAFYLYSALLPLLLFVTVLLFIAYVVLGQVSARVVETRLERQVEWAEQRMQVLESTYWRARAHGAVPQAALMTAVDATWGTAPLPGLEIWCADRDGKLLLTRGDVQPQHMVVPPWLGQQRFAGLATGDANKLELRTRLRLEDGATVLDIGSLLPVNLAVLNHGLEGSDDAVRAGLGPPGRSLQESETMSDSTLLRQGIVGWIPDHQSVTVTPTQIRLDPRSASRPDSLDRGRGLRWESRRETGPGVDRAAADSVFREAPALAPDSLRLRSRYPILNWWYFGYPVQWRSRDTKQTGPPIVISFSVEGATRALLRSGVGVDQVVLIGAGIVVGFLLLLQLVATLRGFQYARAISGAVGKLDRGVRAIRAGDFGHRIAPSERDQLGALALTFNDMSGRLRGLLDERATHEAVERELAIARDVQARLFPSARRTRRSSKPPGCACRRAP
jgi:HAMP domain-containing protein